MAALKCNYCKNSEFKVVDEKIICKTCNKEVNDNEKKFFVLKTENKLCAKLLGFAVGTAVVAVGACVEPLISPFVLPAIIKHFKPFVENIGSFLSESLESTVYSEGTYGKQLTDIFDKELKKICKIGSKQSSGKYLNFYNYCCYCQINYVDVIEKIIEKEIFVDIFTEDAIRVIISEENHYPGYIDEPQILENVISVSKELNIRYKNKIYEQRDLCIQWLIEKNSANIETNFSDIKNQIENFSNFFKAQVKSSCISDDLYEYIKSYNRPLFLEDDTGVSLGDVYVDPVIEGTENRITDEIYDWYEYGNEKILIVKGAAGIGKTSLVSRLIADTYGDSDTPNNLNENEVYPIILRKHYSKFDNIDAQRMPIEVFEKILNVTEMNLDNSLIILDGLDELTLLSTEFNCNEFLKNLSIELERFSNTKVLITSRPMDKIDVDIENVGIKSVVWEKEQILTWCDNFKKASEKVSEKNWCKAFVDNYDELEKNDPDGNKMDIFKAPVILYLACHSDSKISANETIGEFYDTVFRKIASRYHIEKDDSASVFLDNEDDKNANIINWQFTKELAYQMFLHNTLILSDLKLIENAENRTAEVLVKRGIIANKNDLEIDKLKYLAVTHFAKETTSEKGIEFAHKTVYEYFTAVKLYEDYFAEITEDYPENFKKKDALGNEITPLENVWTNIIEAFRYKFIDEDIFNYLNKMELPVYNGKAKDKGKCFDFNTFVKYFVEGMEQKILADLEIKSRVKEYAVISAILTTQISLAFRNLTWFLTERENGFHNEDDNMACKNFDELVSNFCGDLNLKNWKLSEAYLSRAELCFADLCFAKLSEADLGEADLSDVDLSEADLSEAKLSGADLSGAYLRGADLGRAELFRANLSRADLSRADLGGAYLSEADLRGADLSEAKLRGARYCLDKRRETKFPYGFNPKEHGMIEVDIYGEPVKKSETQIMEENKNECN